MGIFSRMSDVIKANINDLLEKAEDPEKMIKQMVLEMEESVNKATLSVAQSIANEKQLQRRLDKEQALVADWQAKAEQAIVASRDDLAKAALEKKLVAQKNVNDLLPTYDTAKATAERLKTQLDQLKKKLDEARSRQNTLIARSNAAKAEKQLNQAMNGTGTDAFSKFDRMESKVEQMEAEAEAFGELNSSDKSLEEEFANLSNPDVDDELEKLKAQISGRGSNE
jgi:phage shock protein A